MLKQRVAQNTGNGQGARVTVMPTQLLYSNEVAHLLCILLCFSPTSYSNTNTAEYWCYIPVYVKLPQTFFALTVISCSDQRSDEHDLDSE
jgi:hypothetical protein